jgi:triosephosphate isomerase (TIM)
MSRKPIMAGNWKMNLDHLEAIQLLQRLAYHLEPQDYEATDIAVVPAFTALRSIQTLVEGDRIPIALGAQSCHWEDAGAFTGEVSPRMLAKLKVRYVICGHSERRTLFAETDEVVNRKVKAVLAADMTPIMCVGESGEQRDAGDAESVVASQVRAGLEGVGADRIQGVVIAYEPVWAIGTGKTATAGDAQAMCAAIRSVVTDLYTPAAGEAVRIQYGGSVKPGNVRELMGCDDIDGALVGGASLDPEDFAVICRFSRH